MNFNFGREDINRKTMREYRTAIMRWRNKLGFSKVTCDEVVDELKKSLRSVRVYHRKSLFKIRYRKSGKSK